MHQHRLTRSITMICTICFLTAFFSAGNVFAGSAALNCQAHDGPCTLPMGNETVTLEITPRPVTAMQESTFTVTVSGSQPTGAPYIDLGMPAMKMGPNRVMLKPAGNGAYTGKGVIVRCKSGRRTWFAHVVLPGAGETRFVFDVVY